MQREERKHGPSGQSGACKIKVNKSGKRGDAVRARPREGARAFGRCERVDVTAMPMRRAEIKRKAARKKRGIGKRIRKNYPERGGGGGGGGERQSSCK